MMDWVLSITVLAALALLVGAWALHRRGVKRQALLMLLLAGVMLVNVAIWTLPGPDGAPPMASVETGFSDGERAD